MNLCYNMFMNDIISAISTPLGKGAISIVRMSGQGCLAIAEKVFFAKSNSYSNPQKIYLSDEEL